MQSMEQKVSRFIRTMKLLGDDKQANLYCIGFGMELQDTLQEGARDDSNRKNSESTSRIMV